ncbi:pheromone-binding protein Gp-9-like [Harpegnathos saltator]|uniref:pheromone-binding protein Gp-9-like n=1 Tax=Harpegnathos saltator TaxID=610380 RepID=UPI00058AF242|nr:pheromone-binding protein Gp-9-like [Harpegnathos saltator]
MKREFAFLIMLVVLTIISAEDFVERLADSLSMTREDIQKCIEKRGTTQEDIMHFDQIVMDNLQTIDFDEKALRLGCFLTCLGQKKEIMSGAYINIENIKKILRSKVKEPKPDMIAEFYQVLDMCNDQVRSKTNECEISLKFLVCIIRETRRLEENSIQYRYENTTNNEVIE